MGATVRLGLARAAETLLGDDPQRVVAALQAWGDGSRPVLPWLPGPLLDALSPLGIEMPKTAEGRLVSRFLAGIPADVHAVDDAVDVLRDDALATGARALPAADSDADERSLREAVDDTLVVLGVAYAQLSPLIAAGNRDAVEATVDQLHAAVASSSERVDVLAVKVAGARPDRFQPPEPVRPTIDLTTPWSYSTRRRRRDVALVPALLFFTVAVAGAAAVLWAVVTGAWP